MAEVLKLQTLKCPNCSRQITKYSKFSNSVTCPSCGSVIKNPLTESKESQSPERIIPFASDEKDFETALVNTLVNEDYVDKNVFSGINTDNVFRAYLPMYLYEGSFNAAWSCESSYKDQEVRVGSNSVSTRDVKKWRPQNGNAAGNFAFLCLANEGSEDLPEELRKFTYQFPYEVMCSRAFDSSLLSAEDENLITIPMNADAGIVWQKHGKDLVERKAREAAANQIGQQEIRNFRASSSFQLSTKGEYVLAPFWFVYYNYKGERYHFLMDGLGKSTSGNYPLDQEDVAFTESKERIKTIVKWLWPIAILAWFVINFTTAVVLFVIWFIAKFVVNIMMNNAIKANLENSKRIRQQGAQNL
jgi:hypothetical protein